MTTPTWPATVPFIVLLSALTYSGPSRDVHTFTPEVGPPKTRRRGTLRHRPLSGRTTSMTADQYATFETFWEDDLKGGVLDFTATHPLRGVTATFRPKGDYDTIPIGGNRVRVAMSLTEIVS